MGICIFSSCSNQDKKHAQNIDSADISITDSIRNSKLAHFNDSLYNLFAKSPQELSSFLGEPKKLEIKQFVNIHNGDADTIYHIDFDSISVSLYYINAQKRYLIGSVELRNDSFLNILGFHLGIPDTTVRNTIGMPNKYEKDSTGTNIFIYELGEIAESYTEFYFKDSKLIRVLYLPYLD